MADQHVTLDSVASDLATVRTDVERTQTDVGTLGTRVGALRAEFDTFRIEMTVRQINTKDQTRSSTAIHVTWYAPAINRWVRKKTDVRSEGRLRESFSEELTEYSRRP